MKVLTKLLNVLVIIFVVIGIASTIYYVGDYFKPQIDYYQIVDSLNDQLVQNKQQLANVDSVLKVIQQEQLIKEQKWQKEKENLVSQLQANQNQNKVKELPLNEMVEYVLDYYNTDTTEAKIVQEGDSIVILVTPKLIHSIGLTIAENRDNLRKLQAYKTYVISSDSLIDGLKAENRQLTLRGVTLESINKDLESINSENKGVIEGKDALIKKVKLQRNLIAVGGAVIIVLLAL
jgi:hypothetical protein